MKGKVIILIIILLVIFLYYQKNYSPKNVKKKAEEKINSAKEERLLIRKQEYDKCTASTYGNPSYSEGKAWELYQICTIQVDAKYPKL